MSWYIDAVAELDELHEQHCASCNAFSGEDCKQCKIGHIVDFLENKYLGDEPTADVVEVVRCKDCEHYREGCDICMLHFSGVDDDAFCSYGVRKAVRGDG